MHTTPEDWKSGPMAFTQSDLDALDQALADSRGARTISFNGETVSFNSIKEIKELRALMTADINAAAGTSPNRLAVTRKGT